MNQSRAQFEKWYADYFKLPNTKVKRFVFRRSSIAPDIYDNDTVYKAWAIWQAARKSNEPSAPTMRILDISTTYPYTTPQEQTETLDARIRANIARDPHHAAIAKPYNPCGGSPGFHGTTSTPPCGRCNGHRFLFRNIPGWAEEILACPRCNKPQ
jgi:hypothetical protein